jgi:hypothetical protein
VKKELLTGCVFSLGFILNTTSDVEAATRRSGYVTGCSIYGKGCVSAPTRPGRFGAEVRLPGGTWISCKQDCPSTLRDETVDFWDRQFQDRGGGLRGRR